jgi:hypothetical protein
MESENKKAKFINVRRYGESEIFISSEGSWTPGKSSRDVKKGLSKNYDDPVAISHHQEATALFNEIERK